MVQQTSSSWYSPHWHHNSFPQLAVVTGFTSAKLGFGNSFLSSFLTQVAQTEALPLYPRWWLQCLPFSQTLQCTKFPRKDFWIPIGIVTNLFRKLLDPKSAASKRSLLATSVNSPRSSSRGSPSFAPATCVRWQIHRLRVSLNYWLCDIQLGGTLSPQVEAVYIVCFNSECNTVRFSHYLSMPWHVLIWACFKIRSLRTRKAHVPAWSTWKVCVFVAAFHCELFQPWLARSSPEWFVSRCS